MARHVVATVASSILANELHRRLTFRADERVGFLATQIEAGGVSFIGLAARLRTNGFTAALAFFCHVDNPGIGA